MSTLSGPGLPNTRHRNSPRVVTLPRSRLLKQSVRCTISCSSTSSRHSRPHSIQPQRAMSAYLSEGLKLALAKEQLTPFGHALAGALGGVFSNA